MDDVDTGRGAARNPVLDPGAPPGGGSPRAGLRTWCGLLVLMLPCLLYSMDLTILNLAVPRITADLRPSGLQMLWIVDIYGFVLAATLITMGAIGDRIGRRRLLFVGAMAFGMASVLAALAPTAEALIAARAVLGLAAATLAPSTLSLIRTMFDDARQRAFAIGVWMASFAVGGAIGPLVGGLLLEHFAWGSVFLVAVPVVMLVLAVGPFVLPEYRAEVDGGVDVTSALLSIAALLTLVFGIKQITVGAVGPLALLSLLASLAIGWRFVRRQRSLATPMIDIGLFGTPRFVLALAVNFAAFFVALGTLLLLAQHLQLVVGLGPMKAGQWSLASAAGFVAGSLIAPILLRGLTAVSVMTSSLLVAALGFGLLADAVWRDSLPLLASASFLFSIGLAPVFTLATDLMVGSAPLARAGPAAALSETSSELGGAMGIATLGSIAVASYRSRIDSLMPATLADTVRDEVRDSLGMASAAAATLPSLLAAPVIDAARQAFSGAFATTSLIAILVCACAALAIRALRRAAPR